VEVIGPVDGYKIRAEVGYPPAFYRVGSFFQSDFEHIEKLAALPVGCEHPSNIACEDFWPEKKMEYSEESDLTKWDIFHL